MKEDIEELINDLSERKKQNDKMGKYYLEMKQYDIAVCHRERSEIHAYVIDKLGCILKRNE